MPDATDTLSVSEFSGLTIGVLALQGAFAEHVSMLAGLGATVREIRLPADLNGLDGLIIPGGESTTIGKLLVHYELLEPLRRLVDSGVPIYGTCAGTILLAKDIGGLDQPLLATMDLVVQRNAFGRQLQSFEEDLRVEGVGEEPLRAVFIRAPWVADHGPGVEVLAAYDGHPVVVRQGRALACSFHPELTDDTRLHAFFMAIAEEGRKGEGIVRAP